MKQQCLESAFRRTRQRMPEGAAIQSRHRKSKLCQCRTVSRCDLYNDGFLPAPWLAPFSLLFNNRFCRIWLADGWHIGMSRKGTCILSYQFPFFDGRKGQALRRGVLDCAGFKPTRETASSARQNLRINRRSANISLLDSWQISTWFIHKWVLYYPDAFGVGKTRASPVIHMRRICQRKERCCHDRCTNLFSILVLQFIHSGTSPLHECVIFVFYR